MVFDCNQTLSAHSNDDLLFCKSDTGFLMQATLEQPIPSVTVVQRLGGHFSIPTSPQQWVVVVLMPSKHGRLAGRLSI